MPESQGRLTRFWQELKRRNVFRVTATYAATAYIILEVINNLAVPLQLPYWISTLALIILLIGLPITVILSWIFDFTPQGIKKTESLEELAIKEIETKPAKRRLRASDIIIAVLFIAVIILAWPRIFRPDTVKRLASSGKQIAVAVMPFQNMTNDTTWNVWQKGIQGSLITYFSNTGDLQVRNAESVNSLIQSQGLNQYASLSSAIASEISQRLDVDIFIYGSIKKAGTFISVDAQIIDPDSKNVLKSFEVNKPDNEEVIIEIRDSLRKDIVNYLLISKLLKTNPGYEDFKVDTRSPQALKNFMLGNESFSIADFRSAVEWYLKAFKADSSFISPMFGLSMAYGNLNMAEESLDWTMKLYRKKEEMLPSDQLWARFFYADKFESPDERIKIIKQLQQIDDKDPGTLFALARIYESLGLDDKAIEKWEERLGILKKWGKVFLPGDFGYLALGEAYHRTRQYKKEKKIYEEIERVNQNHNTTYFSWLVCDRGTLALNEGDTIAAAEYMAELSSILKENSQTEADIASNIGLMYQRADSLDKAIMYYRKALSLDPENPEKMNSLAWRLIDMNKNFDEVYELYDKALKLAANKWDYYNYLDRIGWGKYKEGKYNEALEIFQNLWDNTPYKMYFIKSHLEEVKKAVAEKKSN